MDRGMYSSNIENLGKGIVQSRGAVLSYGWIFRLVLVSTFRVKWKYLGFYLGIGNDWMSQLKRID